MKMEKGMTMVELLITIVVVTILLALGVPSFQEFIKNNRLTAQTNDFVTAIQLARSEAVKRGSGSVICASTLAPSGTPPLPTCDVADGNWSSGWIVFSDLDQEGDLEPGTGACLATEDCIIRTSNGLTKGTLENNDSPAVNNILFRPTGMTDNDSAVILIAEADDCKHEQARTIRITKMGHMTVSHQPCP